MRRRWLATPRIARDPIARWARITVVACLLAWLPTPGSADSPVRLCMLPPSVPFEKDDPRKAMLEEKVARRFEEGLFEVIRSSETEPLVEAVDEHWGAIYDPAFGNVVPNALAAQRQEMIRVLRTGLGCEALIRVSVQVIRALYAGGSARWDGVVVQINTPARQWLLGDEWGWVAALSLWVELFDLDGESLSFRSAGIEPLINFSIRRQVDRLPEDRWLRDEIAVDRAIDSALGPMALDIRERGFPTAQRPSWPFDWPVAP